MLPPTPENEELKSYLSQYFQCIDRSNNMYEIIQKGYSKASGIDFFANILENLKKIVMSSVTVKMTEQC